MESDKPTTAQSDIEDIVKHRTWRRNLPQLVGIFATYLLFMPSIRVAAEEGSITAAQSIPYVGYGLFTLAAGLFLSARFYRISLSSDPDKSWAKGLFNLTDLIVWFVSGVGIGLLLMAAINLVFWAF